MKDKKILVVDFDEESLIALSNLVFEEGFQAVTAMDGLSGYEKFKADSFDLVMVEPMLPKLHGFELMKKINEDPGKKVPIIVVTGIYREPSCKMEALQVYGASAYFTKPWNKEEVRSKMLSLLVNGQKEEAAKPEPPVKKYEPPQPPSPKTSSPPPIDEWGLLKPQPAPHGHKMSKGLDDIEKELRAAVSGTAAPVRKKEPVREIFKEKKEAKPGVDGDIEAMLKGAIGGLGLGLGDTKKKPEPAVRPVTIPKPEPRLEKLEKTEKVSIAKEIKERIPLHDNLGSSIPRPSARGPVHAERASFSIDQTLIDIDKIPLETEKAVPEAPRAEPEYSAPLKKKVYFDEYSAPATRKPRLALIGGIAVALLIVAGSTIMVVKSRKPKEPSRQTVSTLQNSLPSEFALRQEEVQTPSASRQNESKPDPKKAPSKPAEEADNSDIVGQIKPALPAENPPVGLEIQLPPSSGAQDQAAGEATSPETEALTSNEVPAQAQVKQEEPPAVEKPEPGDLVALNEVSIQPALIKRVDPKYPSQAFSMGVSGTVTLNILISETGDVVRTELKKGIKGGYGFEKAAETAVRQWKYRPAVKDGVPVRVWKSIDINFKLTQPQNL